MLNEFDVWSDWYDFNKIFEYYGLIDLTKSTTRKINININGVSGYPHTDNGFRLRSYNKYGSFKKIELKSDLISVPCPIQKKDIGVYWIKVKLPNNEQWDYIGKCEETKDGIRKRLTDHFSKMINAKKYIKYGEQTNNFLKFHEYVRNELSIDLIDEKTKFFEKFVKIKFVKVASNKKETHEKIYKIEGMAIQKFIDINGESPKLNETDVTKGMENF